MSPSLLSGLTLSSGGTIFLSSAFSRRSLFSSIWLLAKCWGWVRSRNHAAACHVFRLAARMRLTHDSTCLDSAFLRSATKDT